MVAHVILNRPHVVNAFNMEMRDELYQILGAVGDDPDIRVIILKGSGSKEDYQLSRKLEAKMRTFAPVVVRGEESQGVKFWGFGKTVYAIFESLAKMPFLECLK